jgi:opacity protein-like surface antigen
MDKIKRGILAIAIALGTSVNFAPTALAEQVIRVFVGPAWTQSADVSGDYIDPSFNFTSRDMNHNTGTAVGLDLIHWFSFLPYLGLGADLHTFWYNTPKQNVEYCTSGSCSNTRVFSTNDRATAFAFPLLARLPLAVSKEHPNGQFQPYFLVGPTIFFSKFVDKGGFLNGNSGSTKIESGSDTSVGVTVGTGLSFMVTPNIDLFTEYRFTRFKPTYNLIDGFGDKLKVSDTVNTHRLLFGVSYHFNLFGG